MPYDLSVPGNMLQEELEQIEYLASLVPENGSIVEIGSLFGRSAVAWAKSCHPSVNVYCVDMFHNIMKNPSYSFYEEFLKHTQHIPNIIPIRAISPYIFETKLPDIQFDLVFLDAIHRNPFDIDNIRYFLPKIKSGGILCGHDYDPGWPDVVENVQLLEKELGVAAQITPQTTLWRFDIP